MDAEFESRAPREEEAEAITDMVVACDVVEWGAPDFELDDLLTDWRRPGFDLKRDARVVAEADGRLVAYAIFFQQDYADVSVHPDVRGLGIGSHLLEWTEARAAELAPAEGSLLLGQVLGRDEDARALLERAGYNAVRTYWRMVIEFDGEPPRPEWPEGVRVRTFDRERDDRAVHTLVQDAFGDNERHVPQSFEEWEAFMIDREAFEPGLWFVAETEGEIVGAVLCPDYEQEGWVRQLAVARDWRRRGLGKALLYQALREFHRRGRKEVALVVDSWNTTGAREMYERAGMHVEREHTRYEKEIASGGRIGAEHA
jgi:mycothiol synthase